MRAVWWPYTAVKIRQNTVDHQPYTGYGSHSTKRPPVRYTVPVWRCRIYGSYGLRLTPLVCTVPFQSPRHSLYTKMVIFPIGMLLKTTIAFAHAKNLWPRNKLHCHRAHTEKHSWVRRWSFRQVTARPYLTAPGNPQYQTQSTVTYLCRGNYYY